MMEHVLTINGGSSSIKFALFQTGVPVQLKLSGKIERIGLSGTTLGYHNTSSGQQDSFSIAAADHTAAANLLIAWLEQQLGKIQLSAVGHRVVHGMQHTQPELVTKALLKELHRISSYDPDHLPLEIKLIEAFQQRFPQLPQVACFDTAFHHTLPRVAKLLPIPRHFDALGIQRYGFHGLSYEYLLQELQRVAGAKAARGRVILAHLGNGASLAAALNGQSIDTSMGFTPTGGVMMGTRTGDLDPGVAWYLLQSEKLNPTQFNHMINHESGLLGVSETSSDMHDLLTHAATDERALEAIELFCYQVKKCIGSYTAVLNGLDTLVFSGGIGENAPAIRARICEGLDFLGIVLDAELNAANAEIVSANSSRVEVRVIHTNEELVIATSVFHLIQGAN
jgi:acetate kinase